MIRFDLYCEIGSAFFQEEYQDFTNTIWIEAKSIALNFKHKGQQVSMLRKLGQLLAQVKQWEKAEMVASLINDSEEKAIALQQLGHTLVQAQEWERAKTTLAKAEVAIYEVEESQKKTKIFYELILTLLQIQEWENVVRLIHNLKEDEVKADALRILGLALTKAKQQEDTHTIWIQAEAVAQAIDRSV